MSIIRKQPQSPHYALAIQEYSLAMKTISVDEKRSIFFPRWKKLIKQSQKMVNLKLIKVLNKQFFLN